MASISIIGAGMAGLHRGLFLQQYGIPATIYTRRPNTMHCVQRIPN
jgi:2-polyprenyl-6-methoxyphenol hydroxylase-like FAD-dependent oxidoreductase